MIITDTQLVVMFFLLFIISKIEYYLKGVRVPLTTPWYIVLATSILILALAAYTRVSNKKTVTFIECLARLLVIMIVLAAATYGAAVWHNTSL